MARTIYCHVEVGRRVYVSYNPQRAGIIREVIQQPMRLVKPRSGGPETEYAPPPNVKVQWVNGTTTEESSLALSDFDWLIEDHKKKLATHLAMKAKLEALNA